MKRFAPILLLLLGGFLVTQSKGGCEFKFPDIPGILKPAKVTQVTYVWEKDTSAIPRPVASALNKLNQLGILATDFEEDTVDGDDQVPDQYKIALEAARKAGLPSLVVQSGEKVVKVLKDPKTLEEVLGVAK